MPGWQRLFTANIDHRRGQPSAGQRSDQILVDHRGATPGVDQHRRWLEAGQQGGIVDIPGGGRIGQQVDHVIGLGHQPRQLVERRHFAEWRQASRAAGHATQHDVERLQEAGDRRADLTGADDQHPAACQATRQAAIPALLALGLLAGDQLALVGKHVAQHVLGHDLPEHADRPGQLVVPGQILCQQWGDARPGRL
jgi:hypothetical protein